MDLAKVAPVQLAIRLLMPPGSLLLELPEVRADGRAIRRRGLCYPWKNSDARVDALVARINETVRSGEKRKASRGEIFREDRELADAGEWAESPMAVARNDSLSDRALVLLSGAR